MPIPNYGTWLDTGQCSTKHLCFHSGVPPRRKRPVTCMWGQPTCIKWPKIGVVRMIWMCATPLFYSVLSADFQPFLTCNVFSSAAGNAFSQAAHLHLQMQSKHDAATNFIDAGNAFKKADPQGDHYRPREYTTHSLYELLSQFQQTCAWSRSQQMWLGSSRSIV